MEDIETIVTGIIYRNAAMIPNPSDARRIAQAILAEFTLQARLDAQP